MFNKNNKYIFYEILIYRIVAPKKARLETALASLAEKQAALAAAKQKLEELSKYLQKLQKEYDEKFAEKEELIKKVFIIC